MGALFAVLVGVNVVRRWSTPLPPAAFSSLAPAPKSRLPQPALIASSANSRVSPLGPVAGAAGPADLGVAEKNAAVARIKGDYADIRNRVTAEYSAAGNAYPGGLNAYLRQLALLERERRADLAAVLSAREFEDLQMRETAAGQLVERLLGGTTASDAQRRAVFREQQRFDDRFAPSFDVTQAALLERERARQQTQERIRGVLGDELFAAWLVGEGDDFKQASLFAARLHLPATVPLELRRVENEFTLRRLELAAVPNLPAEQRHAALLALAQQTEIRVLSMIGAGAFLNARRDVLGWLPRR
jgi:hypothetical protein